MSLIVLMAAKTGNLPNDLIGGFAVVMVLGLILSELGMKLPLLKNIGGHGDPGTDGAFFPGVLAGIADRRT